LSNYTTAQQIIATPNPLLVVSQLALRPIFAVSFFPFLCKLHKGKKHLFPVKQSCFPNNSAEFVRVLSTPDVFSSLLQPAFLAVLTV
jgi:hypothetical protein